MWSSSKFFLSLAIALGMTVAAFVNLEAQPAETLPRADAGSLWDYITKTKPYHEWDLWPGKGKMYDGSQPHGAYLTLYTNSIASSAAQNNSRLKNGAILVKEGYSQDKELEEIAVMYKIEGYHPAANDWFWVEFAPDGKVRVAGKVGSCINCHGTRGANDFIFTGKVAPY